MDLRDGNKNSHVELFNKNEILQYITTVQTNISNQQNWQVSAMATNMMPVSDMLY